MNKSILTILSITAILAGCVPPPTQPALWLAQSGSKADGTLTLAYETNPSGVIRTEPSQQQGQQVADERCKSWGYSKATAFDFISEKCQTLNTNTSNDPLVKLLSGGSDSSCSNYLKTQKYQCEK